MKFIEKINYCTNSSNITNILTIFKIPSAEFRIDSMFCADSFQVFEVQIKNMI